MQKFIIVLTVLTILKIYEISPVNCAWGAWDAWSTCSKTCGGGSQTRSRVIKIHEENEIFENSNDMNMLKGIKTPILCVFVGVSGDISKRKIPYSILSIIEEDLKNRN